MNIKALLFCVFMIVICSCKKSNYALQHKTDTDDSLAFYFQQANLDTLPYKKRYVYAQKALDIVSKQPNDSLYRVNMFKVANRFWNISAFEDYKKITNEIITITQDAKDSASIGKVYEYLGDYYSKLNVSDTAYHFYNKAENIYKQLKDFPKVIESQLDKSRLQFNEKDYVGSEISVIEVLKLLRTIQDDDLKYDAINLLGVIYNELSEYDKSLEFHQEALSILNNNKVEDSTIKKSFTLNNIGIVYQAKKDDKQAIRYFKAALKERQLYYANTSSYVIIVNNLGNSEMKIKNFQRLPKLFFQVLKVADSISFAEGVSSCQLNLSEYYSLNKDTVTSIKFAKQSYITAKNNAIFRNILPILKHLSLIDPKNATKYSAEYFRINDSLQLAERRMRNKFARIEYETEELEIEKDKLTSQRTIIIYSSGGLILLLISILAIRSRRAKNRELKFARQQQEANEEIYRLVLDQQQKIEQGREAEKIRIAQELHDGVMGRLSSIRLNLFALEKKPDPETIAQCLPYIEQIQHVEKEIRTIAYDLERNIFSDSTSFPAVVADIIKAIKSHSDTDFEVNIDTQMNWETIDSTVKMELYRILQEALQNTDKHAKAKKVTITIAPVNDGIAVTISDDGIGFDTTNTKKGLGLKGMENRVRKIGGALQIHSQPEKGTIIRLYVPAIGYGAELSATAKP